MTPIPVTLTTAACATLLNFWLSWRIGELRNQFKVSVGDGGHEPLLRRMRAQSNYVENAPFVLILLGGLELSGANRLGLAGIAAIFILARIAHPIGMDAAENGRWRMAGMAGNMIAFFALSIWAVIWVGKMLLSG
jgi:uncharacterized membrane protein YecN with MAPEG domain